MLNVEIKIPIRVKKPNLPAKELSKISIKVHCRESIKFHESQGKTSGIALVNVYFQSSSTYDPLSQIAIGFVPPENKPCAGYPKDLHENQYLISAYKFSFLLHKLNSCGGNYSFLKVENVEIFI